MTEKGNFNRLEPSEAFETLGVHLAPDGNHEAAYTALSNTAKLWADKVRTSHLKEAEASTALKTTIMKTLEYPLPALSLSRQQCDKIMAPILKAVLPKAGYNRHFSRKLLYGPLSHFGAGVRNLYTT